MKKNDILTHYHDYILDTYTRLPVVIVKGKGMTLTDIDGHKYLDFFPGWGVSNVGHCHPKVMAAVRNQIRKLIHIPNTFYHIHQAKLAQEIVRRSFPGKVFFCNSGAEATEGAIKFARAYGQEKRYEIITMKNSFHGRTLGALTATGQKKYQQGFQPLLPGFKCVTFNDLEALKSALTEATIAIMLELIQGEGGIHVADEKYLQDIQSICRQRNILLIIDEVQTGIGRTGTTFGYQQFGITPDIMTLAKSLGGGLPIGAFVVRKELAAVFKPGMHASTFGGSPLITHAALGVFKALDADHMLKNTRDMGKYLLEKLTALKNEFSIIKEIRGKGLMIGVELTVPGASIVEECLRQKLLINCTQENVLRLMPALNVTKKQIDRALYILKNAITKIQK